MQVWVRFEFMRRGGLHIYHAIYRTSITQERREREERASLYSLYVGRVYNVYIFRTQFRSSFPFIVQSRERTMMRKEKKRKGRETHKRKHSDRYEHSFYLGLLSWPSFLSLTPASVYISHSSGVWTKAKQLVYTHTHTHTYIYHICCTVYTLLTAGISLFYFHHPKDIQHDPERKSIFNEPIPSIRSFIFLFFYIFFQDKKITIPSNKVT